MHLNRQTPCLYSGPSLRTRDERSAFRGKGRTLRISENRNGDGDSVNNVGWNTEPTEQKTTIHPGPLNRGEWKEVSMGNTNKSYLDKPVHNVECQHLTSDLSDTGLEDGVRRPVRLPETPRETYCPEVKSPRVPCPWLCTGVYGTSPPVLIRARPVDKRLDLLPTTFRVGQGSPRGLPFPRLGLFPTSPLVSLSPTLLWSRRHPRTVRWSTQG